MIDRVVFRIGPAVGAVGMAEAVGYSQHVSGKVLAVRWSYPTGNTANSTDILLRDEGGAQLNYFALIENENDASGGVFYPRASVQFEPNGAGDREYGADFPAWDYHIVHGRIRGHLRQTNAGTVAEVTVWLGK
jgi:hypothetical protein